MSYVSLTIATRNHAPLLARTLKSIFNQNYFGLEVIITDDGSTDNTPEIVARYPSIKYFHLDNDRYHNGVTAKNNCLKHATADIVIQQSDDVIHAFPDTIEKLVTNTTEGAFTVATVYDYDWGAGRILRPYAGADNPYPLLFLGATLRKDVCAIGGYDPDFAEVCWYDDTFFADGLTQGLKLTCQWVPELGLHQHHPKPDYNTAPATLIYNRKVGAAKTGEGPWASSSGPWKYIPGLSVYEAEELNHAS
jgi:glycosyltransferase involved in cell wall biosynthesis